MNIYTKIIVIMIAMWIALEIIISGLKNKIMNKLASYIIQKNYGEFDKLANKKITQFIVNPFNIKFMQLNIALEKDDEKDIEEILKVFDNVKLNNEQKKAVYSQAFLYAAENKNKQLGDKYYKLACEYDKNNKLIYERLFDTYINNGYKYLDDALSEYNDPNNKNNVILLSMIITMYENKKDFVEANKYKKILENRN